MDRLAESAGVSVKTVRMAERGTHWPQARSRTGLERALGWTPGAIDAARTGVRPTVVPDEPEIAPTPTSERRVRLVPAPEEHESPATEVSVTVGSDSDVAIRALEEEVRSQGTVIRVLTAEIERLRRPS